MKNKLEYDLGKISTHSFRPPEQTKDKVSNASPKNKEDILTKITTEVDYDLLCLIRGYARDKGMLQKEAILDIFNSFFENHQPSDRPKEVVEREKLRIQQDKRRRHT